MKSEKLLSAIGKIDDNLIFYAVNEKRKKKISVWATWGAIAACLMFVVLGSVFILRKEEPSNISVGGVLRHYKDLNLSLSELAIEWPWEYLTNRERYGIVSYNGREYYSRRVEINKSLLGEKLETLQIEGIDGETGQKYQENFDVYKIKGISETLLIAVDLEEAIVVYTYGLRDTPTVRTLGELLENYSLSQTMPLEYFSQDKLSGVSGNFRINDDAYIWEILESCGDTELILQDGWRTTERKYISFTATSETLGFYNRAFYVTKDGYIWTNIFEYGYIFDIGETAANQIIQYALENGIETEVEPYAQSLAGTVVEIGDGYILVDDSILCVDESDGMIFKVPTEDLRIRRYIDRGVISEGDVVCVNFEGKIDTASNNTVTDAYEIQKGHLVDGEVAIPE